MLCVGFIFIFIGFAGFYGIVIRLGFFFLILIPAFRCSILIVLAGFFLALTGFGVFCRFPAAPGCFFISTESLGFAIFFVPVLWFLVIGYFLVLIAFSDFCGFPAVFSLFLVLGCSGGFEFLFRFFQRLFDKPNHEFFLGEAAMIGFLIVFKVFLYPLEQFLAHLKC